MLKSLNINSWGVFTCFYIRFRQTQIDLCLLIAQWAFICNPSDRGGHCWAKICTWAGDTSLKSPTISEGLDTPLDGNANELILIQLDPWWSVIDWSCPKLFWFSSHIYSWTPQLDGKRPTKSCFTSFKFKISNSATTTFLPGRMGGLQTQTWGYNWIFTNNLYGNLHPKVYYPHVPHDLFLVPSFRGEFNRSVFRFPITG
jgi:hypothetical protein